MSRGRGGWENGVPGFKGEVDLIETGEVGWIGCDQRRIWNGWANWKLGAPFGAG